MNIKKCERCLKTLLSEEFENHDCTIMTHNTQEIGISYWFEAKPDENGDQVLIAQGLNGILYRFVKCIHNPPHPNIRQTIFDKKSKNNRKFTDDEDNHGLYRA